jgi:hypothetical protein
MVILAALREKGWFDVRTEKMMWSNLSRSYNAEYQLVSTFEEIQYPNNAKIIILDESADILLEEFQHPENAVYVFGRSTLNQIQDNVPHDYAVRLRTPNPKDIFGISVACAVLFSRELQWP